MAPRSLLLAAALATTLFFLPGSVAAQEPSDTSALLDLERQWNEAHRRGDPAALDRLWADELVVQVPGMAPMPKAEALAFARSGAMRFERYETSDLRILVFGNAALVQGRMLRTRTRAGRTVADDWRFLKVYTRTPDGWRVVAFTATPAVP